MKKFKLSSVTVEKLDKISEDLLMGNSDVDFKMPIEKIVAKKCHGCTGYCGTLI